MRARVFLSLLSLLFFILPAWADQLIIEPDRGREPLLQAIQTAKHSIKLVMYGFTDDILLQALIQKKMKGQTVNIILEESPYKAENENKKTIAQLNAHHMAWQGSLSPPRLVHQKTLLIDGRKAIIMTFNFTRSAFKNDRNFGLIIEDPKRVRLIESLFSADWNHTPTQHLAPDLIISPDNSREALLTLINHAKQAIRIYAQDINDYKIVGALAKAAQRGIHVEILTSKKIRKKQANYLARAGVNVKFSYLYYIHAKVLIIDNQKAVIGSINLTKASLDNNRELSVISEDPTVIQQLNATFNNDWNAAKKDKHA